MLLDRRTVLVTGASGMLGRALLPVLWDAGASLALPFHGQSPDPSFVALHSVNASRVFMAKADLMDPGAVHSFVAGAENALGTVQVLVNLAGGYEGGKPLEEHTPEEWDRMMALNVRTAFLAIRETLPAMKRNRFGRIVNVSALPAIRSGAGRVAYAVSKRAVIALTESLSDELRGTGVMVNAVAPSILRAPGDAGEGVSTADIAAMILSLCSPDRGGASGNVIRMFGGM